MLISAATNKVFFLKLRFIKMMQNKLLNTIGESKLDDYVVAAKDACFYTGNF